MRKILFLLLLPVWLSAQTTTKGKKPCTPSRPPFICCPDTAKVIVNVAAGNCCDTAFIKSLVEIIKPPKEEKTPWDKWGPLIIALLSLLAGAFAYRYAIKQMIAKTRLDWIHDFKPLVTSLTVLLMRNAGPMDELSEKNTLYAKLQREYDRLEETLNDKSFPAVQKQQGQAELAKIKPTLDAMGKEIDDLYKENEKEFIKTHKALIATEVSLDPIRYETHRNLKVAVNNFSQALVAKSDDVAADMERTRASLIAIVQQVLAEQWKIAEGKSIFK